MPDIDGIVFLSIPIVAIIAGTCSSIFNRWIQHRQEIMRIKAMSGQPLSSNQYSDINAMRQEMAQFRETVMQYDMSVEKTLQDIKARLDYIENERIRPAVQPVYAVKSEEPVETQQVGIGH